MPLLLRRLHCCSSLEAWNSAKAAAMLRFGNKCLFAFNELLYGTVRLARPAGAMQEQIAYSLQVSHTQVQVNNPALTDLLREQRLTGFSTAAIAHCRVKRPESGWRGAQLLVVAL